MPNLDPDFEYLSFLDDDADEDDWLSILGDPDEEDLIASDDEPDELFLDPEDLLSEDESDSRLPNGTP